MLSLISRIQKALWTFILNLMKSHGLFVQIESVLFLMQEFKDLELLLNIFLRRISC